MTACLVAIETFALPRWQAPSLSAEAAGTATTRTALSAPRAVTVRIRGRLAHARRVVKPRFGVRRALVLQERRDVDLVVGDLERAALAVVHDRRATRLRA